MKRNVLKRLLHPLLPAGLAAALLLLAGLQYRWTGEIAEADRERLEHRLDTAAVQFRLEFNRELFRLAAAFSLDPRTASDRPLEGIAERYERWRAYEESAGERIENIYLLELGGAAQALRFSQERLEFEPAAAPGFLARLDRLGPGWTFYADPPALVHGLPRFRPPGARTGSQRQGRTVIALELDSEWLRREFLPQLDRQYYQLAGEVHYQVAILQGEERPALVYASEPGLRAEDFMDADRRIPVFWTREEAGIRALRGRGRGERMVLRGGPPLIRAASESDAWILAVKHREGSVDAIVSSVRRRNLAISSGILVLLGAGMAIALASARRAQRLARAQMEFVAGVSHELRTPLAVIRSAGDNLAEGVVSQPGQVREYGALVRDEGRRLTGMVEQTLQFAALQSGKTRYNLESVPAGRLVEDALSDLAAEIEGAGFEAETRIADGLPAVRVDPQAVKQCVRNLVHNALKYGNEGKWLRVDAARNGKTVEIRVSDRGIGIDAEDLEHIFDPFYRGHRATDAQIPGSGLGLSLARDAAEASGGRLTAESRPGEGSTFTLSLPAAKA